MRRVVVQFGPPDQARMAVAADIAAWLDDHVDRIADVVAACRATGPWMHTHGVATRSRLVDGRTIAAGVRDDALEQETWRWWAGLGDDRVAGTATSRHHACERMDGALRLAGRVL